MANAYSLENRIFDNNMMHIKINKYLSIDYIYAFLVDLIYGNKISYILPHKEPTLGTTEGEVEDEDHRSASHTVVRSL